MCVAAADNYKTEAPLAVLYCPVFYNLDEIHHHNYDERLNQNVPDKPHHITSLISI
jgi:hypothetical protein